MRSQVQFLPEPETLDEFFPYVLADVDKITWYLLLVGGGKYSMELVKVRKNWPIYHNYKKAKN